MANNDGGEPTPQPGNQNPEPTEPNNDNGGGSGDDVLDKFKQIKENYETKLSDKDKEIEKLKKQLAEKNDEVDTTINDLNDEVQARIEQSEAYQELLSTVEELQKDKAEATVDAFIQRGIILPAQRKTAIKLCLSDNETFSDLYKDAKPIVDTHQVLNISIENLQFKQYIFFL